MSTLTALARRLMPGLAVLAVLAVSAPQADAQTPKVGSNKDGFSDDVDLGFKIKPPKDWDYIPPAPDEDELIGKFTPRLNKHYTLPGGDYLWRDAFLVKFDRRGSDSERAFDYDEALDKYADRCFSGTSGAERAETNELKVDKVPTKEVLYTARTRGGSEAHIYAMQYFFSEDLVVAYLFVGPADKKKWRKWESAYKSLGKSMRRVELKEIEGAEAVEGETTFRSRRRAALTNEVRSQPGWELKETDNYFIISSSDDRQFLRELEQRLEAIRNVYEGMYSIENADRFRLMANKRLNEARAKHEAESEDDEDEGAEKGESSMRTKTSRSPPMERSRCSVVRVCKSRGEYMEYGGPPGSAGYWSFMDEELVIYDDQGGGGRRNTWATLNHEAFHQYIFYFYGNLSPHSWYNEGTGDYFAGYQLKAGRFTLKPFDWRVQTIREAIKADEYVPMEDFFRYTQRDYYGEGIGRNYAQGWSLIYFLRTGKKGAKGWNSDWDSLLDDYLAALNDAWIEVKVSNILNDGVEIDEDGKITFDFSNSSEEDARSKAVELAVAGIDWEEFEAAWKAYTL